MFAHVLFMGPYLSFADGSRWKPRRRSPGSSRFPGSVGFRGFWELRTGKVGLLGLRLVSCYSGMGRGGDGLQEVNPACTCSQELQEARQQLRNVLSSATATEDSRPAGGPTLKGWVVLRSAGWCAGFSLIPVVAVLQCFDLQNLLPLLP